MKILCSESFPLMETYLHECLREFSWGKQICVEKSAPHKHCDLLLSDRTFFCGAEEPTTALTLIPGSCRVTDPPKDGLLLVCGMAPQDPVTLSSIGEDRAMLCLQQEISLFGCNVGPFESKIPFDRRYSLYKNLAVGLALYLAELLIRKETRLAPDEVGFE
jgi:hypothetical protein